jgi:predicted phage tail protein
LAGNRTVTITGSGFASGATVTVGGTAAVSWTLTSASEISAVFPGKAAGTYGVTVAVGGQSDTLANAYTYAAAPTATKPGAPATLTGTGGKGWLTATWAYPADDGGSAVTQYRVQYNRGMDNTCSNPGSGTWSALEPVTAPSLTFTWSGLANGNYCIRVYADNVVGNGTAARMTSGRTAVQVMTAPGDPRSATAESTLAGEITLSWLAPLDDGGSPITFYRVRSGSVSGSSVTCSSANTGTTDDNVLTTSFTLTGLSSSSWYCMRVRATNTLGTSNYVYVGPVRASPLAAPSAPVSVVVTPGTNKVDLSWTDPGDGGSPITNHRVEYSSSATGPWGVVGVAGVGANTSATVTGLTNGTPYFFHVSAYNSIGWSTYSTPPATATPLQPYTGTTPNSRYPASGQTGVIQGTTYALADLYTIPGIVYVTSSCVGGAGTSGCSRSSFDAATGVFTFNGNFGSRTANYTIDWSIPDTSTTFGTNGSFTIYFD